MASVQWLQDNWLNGHAYIPNILAGATGFCIGAPFALVILASFTAEREVRATLDRVNRLSALAWDSFREIINAFTAYDRYEIIVDQARDVQKYYDEASAAINLYISYASESLEMWDLRTCGPNDDAVVRDYFDNFKRIEAKFRTAVNAVTNILNFETEDDWAQITGSWRVLDQYVRLQRLEQGLEWFDKTPDAGLRKWMSRQDNPLQDLQDAVEIRRYTADTSESVDTMRNAIDTFSYYCRWENPIHLGQYLLHTGNIFTPHASKAYSIKRDAAQLFILDLQRYIGLVEIEYWPRAQTVPKRESNEPEMTAREWIGSLQTPDGQEHFKKQYLEYVSRRKRERRKQLRKRILWGVSPIGDPQTISRLSETTLARPAATGRARPAGAETSSLM